MKSPVKKDQEGTIKIIKKGDWYIDKESGVLIECYVTDDARRFLSLRGTARVLDFKGAGSTAISRNLKSNWIQPYLSDPLKQWLDNLDAGNIETLSGAKSRNVTPFEASLFVDLCKAYVNAQRDGLFTDKNGVVIPKWTRQHETADKLYIMMSAFAKVGIIALIDEITGYQEIRDRKALQAILDKFLRKELAAWAKTFPDEFYKEIFRLRGWQWKGMKVNRPSVVGKYTNDIVYERLAPGILKELQKKNPKDEKGQRKAKNFQWLTDDVGHPALAQHLYAVIGLMRASASWTQFHRMLQRSFPKKEETLPLLMDE